MKLIPFTHKMTLKLLIFIISVSSLLTLAFFVQSFNKKKINALIKELTPTQSLKTSYKNLDLFGFDVLDENKKRLSPSQFKFNTGKIFYISLYGKRKITEGKNLDDNKFERCKAVLEHQNGGYFWSTETFYLYGQKEGEIPSEDWQIGGIYKVLFEFITPEYAIPGNYILNVNKEKSDRLTKEMMIILNEVRISIKSLKTPKERKIEDHNLSLSGCLLNPAVHRKSSIAFLWTGNIEFHINRDLRNFNKIIVIAKGTPALGIYPLLKIYMNNKEIGHAYVNGEWNQYEFDLRLNEEAHLLKVRFDNDGGGPGEDRNMYVNMIKLLN